MKYVLNHYYKLRHDRYRTLIHSSNINNTIVEVDNKWMDIIHPIYAMILSFFSKPITIETATKRIASFLSIKEETAYLLIIKMVNNRDYFHIHYKGHDNNFPKNLLIHEDELTSEISNYEPSMFLYERVDLETHRLYNAPIDVTFMVNNKCLTDCIYCYANKNHECKMLGFSMVEKIIEEAHKSSIRNFSVDGGEFFIYLHWKELLETLKAYKYVPYLVSTKYPVSENNIQYFSSFNIPLQISLDSYNSTVLNQMVGNIPNYADRMTETIQLVDKYCSFQIATILTKYNGTIENLEDMFNHIKNYKNIKKWNIRIAFKSLYSKTDFSNIRLDRSYFHVIQKWVNEKQNDVSFEISFSTGRETNFFQTEGGSKNFIGDRCSANSSHMFILPDGQVTICEQLYWDKRFIIGDLKTQSITDIWRSDKALNLANPQRSVFSKESPCNTCAILSSCNAAMNRCYANILKVYGKEHWDFPDPRCINAPKNIPESIYV